MQPARGATLPSYNSLLSLSLLLSSTTRLPLAIIVLVPASSLGLEVELEDDRRDDEQQRQQQAEWDAAAAARAAARGRLDGHGRRVAALMRWWWLWCVKNKAFDRDSE